MPVTSCCFIYHQVGASPKAMVLNGRLESSQRNSKSLHAIYYWEKSCRRKTGSTDDLVL